MRYLWVAAVGAALLAGPAVAKAPKLKVPVPSEFPKVLPVPPPAPPIIYTVPPPPPPTYARPPQPKGNPGYWVTSNDYPAEALREEISGITGFRIAVGIDGRVSQCEIIASSGSALLDATTCALITRRARFTPARDGDGQPAPGFYSNRIRWVIPIDLPPEPGTSTLSFVVNADGKVSDCRVKGPNGPDVSGELTCPDEDQFNQPFKDKAGKAVARRVSIRLVVTLASAPVDAPARAPAPRRWQSSNELPVAGTSVTEAIVETDGTVSDCRIVTLAGPKAGTLELGANYCPKRYERGYAAANGQSVRTLLRMTETVVITPVAGKR